MICYYQSQSSIVRGAAMPRRSRRKSHSGIYHAMVRGIDRQLIFRDPADFLKYLRVLEECKRVSSFEIYAYCLMPNHVHLLIREGSEDLGKAFQRIGSRYAYWFNKKYERCGHLFQDRFKSEPVEDRPLLSSPCFATFIAIRLPPGSAAMLQIIVGAVIGSSLVQKNWSIPTTRLSCFRRAKKQPARPLLNILTTARSPCSLFP